MHYWLCSVYVKQTKKTLWKVASCWRFSSDDRYPMYTANYNSMKKLTGGFTCPYMKSYSLHRRVQRVHACLCPRLPHLSTMLLWDTAAPSWPPLTVCSGPPGLSAASVWHGCTTALQLSADTIMEHSTSSRIYDSIKKLHKDKGPTICTTIFHSPPLFSMIPSR